MDGAPAHFQLMEPASPEALIPGFGFWPWLAAAALVSLTAVVLVRYWKRRKSATRPHCARNAAFVAAAASLEKLATVDARIAALQASLILRHYLRGAAGDGSLYETHEEFASRHDALSALLPDARSAAADGFARLAALKYAPEIPGVQATVVVAQSRALLETLHSGFTA
ncbi:MAG: hypothetical protein RLZZ282_1092 [Verrucomicrobiota bacterium]